MRGLRRATRLFVPTVFGLFVSVNTDAAVLFSQPVADNVIQLDGINCGSAAPCFNYYTALRSGSLDTLEFYGNGPIGSHFSGSIFNVTACMAAGGGICLNDNAHRIYFAESNLPPGSSSSTGAMKLYNLDLSPNPSNGQREAFKVSIGDTLQIGIAPYTEDCLGRPFSCHYPAGTTLGEGTSWFMRGLSDEPLTEPFLDLMRRSILDPEVVEDGKKMTATFTPADGKSLAEAAVLGGFDHFNWLQLITGDERVEARKLGELPADSAYEDQQGNVALTLPYIDPPHGGYRYQLGDGGVFPVQDNLDWYWDEEFAPDGTPATQTNVSEVKVFRSTDRVDFEDAPCDKLGFDKHFKTFLVAVHADGTGVAIDLPTTSFEWEYRGGFLCLLDSVEVLKNLNTSLLVGELQDPTQGIHFVGLGPSLNAAEREYLSLRGVALISAEVSEPMAVWFLIPVILWMMLLRMRRDTA